MSIENSYKNLGWEIPFWTDLSRPQLFTRPKNPNSLAVWIWKNAACDRSFWSFIQTLTMTRRSNNVYFLKKSNQTFKFRDVSKIHTTVKFLRTKRYGRIAHISDLKKVYQRRSIPFSNGKVNMTSWSDKNRVSKFEYLWKVYGYKFYFMFPKSKNANWACVCKL